MSILIFLKFKHNCINDYVLYLYESDGEYYK